MVRGRISSEKHLVSGLSEFTFVDGHPTKKAVFRTAHIIWKIKFVGFVDPGRRTTLEPRAPIQPPLKWAGGKRWLVDKHLRPLYEGHEHRRLVEPFVGGMGVTLSLRPMKALLNDINPHLINFYRRLKQGLTITIDAENTKSCFYANRERFNQLVAGGLATGRVRTVENDEAAQLFYYLNRHCFNGLCRFNRSGFFNTPMGRYTNPKFETDLTPYAKKLRGWAFTSGAFDRVKIDRDDFVYADPPYHGTFDGYAAGGFTWEDQEATVNWLAQHEGPAVLCNTASPEILKLYKSHGFDISRQPEAPRRIRYKGRPQLVHEVIAVRNIK